MLTKLKVMAALATVLAGAAPAKAQSFQNLVETFYADELRAHPTAATDTGLHDYDGELDDLSRDGQAKNIARLHKALDAFTAFDPATLSDADRNDREMLIGNIKGKLLDLEMVGYWQNDPNVYVRSATSAIFNLVHRDFAPLADRLRSVIARERQIPVLLTAAKVNIEHPPQAFVDIAIRNVGGSIDFLKTGTPAAFAAVEDQELKREFTEANESAIAAFDSYRTYLEQELKPKADGNFALGSELFAKRIAYNEMVDIPPETLLDIAYAQLHKDQHALSKVARQIHPEAPIEAVLKEIRAQHPTVDMLIPTARGDLADLRAFVLDRRIATIPLDLLPKVEETPGFERATTAAAIDPPGPLERQVTQAFYYITPPDAGLPADKLEQYLEAYDFPGLEIISVHEVWPGHFMQYLTRLAHPEWSLARQMAETYSTAEGWAHYAEQMMVEQGLGGRAPKLEIAQLEMALLRDCRFIAALEMHTKGKSVDDAAQLFMKECGSPEPEARREALRGTRDPGYINYTLGKLEILKLRDDYRAKMGDKFSLTDFHDRLLAAGLVPIKLIRREMMGEDGPVL
ncbi:MAG TPA: DUF885 domain-containing protein [Methylocella sp.]|nr:DUF885 domain-containing protein [Methylocella sp.]